LDEVIQPLLHGFPFLDGKSFGAKSGLGFTSLQSTFINIHRRFSLLEAEPILLRQKVEEVEEAEEAEEGVEAEAEVPKSILDGGNAER